MASRFVLYTGNRCHKCNLVKEFLRRHGVEPDERNVHTDRAFLEELRALNLNAIPVLVVDGEVHVGYDPEVLARLVREQHSGEDGPSITA